MTIWLHPLTSLPVITSCQNSFIYSAIATSSGSELKKKLKKKKKKNKDKNKTRKKQIKKKNSAPDCE